MNAKVITSILYLGSIGLLSLSPSLEAERRPLDPPSLMTSTARSQFMDDFRRTLEMIETLLEGRSRDELLSMALLLWNTTDPHKLDNLLAMLLDKAQLQLQGSNEAPLRADLTREIQKARALIDSQQYLWDVPVSVTIDRERRAYHLEWAEATASGERATHHRDFPFVPPMTIVIEARIEEGGFGYTAHNSPTSKAPITELWVEAVSPHSEMLTDDQTEVTFSGSSTAKALRIWYRAPGDGYLKDFRFTLFEGGSLHSIQPGESVLLPPVLRVEWAHLPGVVRCWAEVDRFHVGHYLSAETDPSTATRAFDDYEIVDTPVGPKKVPRYMYVGRTLGPVPVPGPEVTRGEFVTRLFEQWKTGCEWGWCPGRRSARRLEHKLSTLTAETGREELGRVLEEVEKAFEGGAILEEAHVLLRENLRYLRDEL